MQIERNPDRKQIKHTNLTYQFYEWQIGRNSKISNKTYKLKKIIEKKQISSITSKLEQIQKYQKFTPVKYRTYT